MEPCKRNTAIKIGTQIMFNAIPKIKDAIAAKAVIMTFTTK